MRYVGLCIVLGLLLRCSGKENASDQTTIQLDAADSVSYQLSSFNPLNLASVVLSEGTVGAEKRKEIDIPLSHPTFAVLEINDLPHTLYLEPGYDLRVSVADGISKTSYSGSGAAPNEYLKRMDAVIMSFQQNPDVWSYSSDQFLKVVDSLENDLNELYAQYTATVDVSEEVRFLLNAKNQVFLTFIKQQYVLMNYNVRTDEIPPALKSASASVLFDSRLLRSNMYHYALAVATYFDAELYPNLPIDTTKDSSDQYPILAANEIAHKDVPREIEEFLLAKNIDYQLALAGITPALDQVYDQFKEEFSESVYTTTIDREYQAWEAISAGKEAPEIKGLTIDGDTTLLSDLRGHLVYIDVWATWCGPCVEEFPHYDNILSQFSAEDSVKFLFVSVDHDQNKWVDYLEEKSDVPQRAVHINDQGGKMRKPYKIWEIPRCILVDREGNIIDANAPRPSSGQMVDLLRQHLNS